MRSIIRRIKPTSGFANYFHFGLVLVIPVVTLVLVEQHFVQLALSVVVLSKWRMFAVRPRFWAANVRANAVDLMVGMSLVLFMAHTPDFIIRLTWAVAYAIWLLYFKPGSSIPMVTTQAFIGQLCALMALYLTWANGPVAGLSLLTGLFCFLSARHFFDTFDEPYAKMLSYVWAYFGAALAWILSHWLLYYQVLAQPTLLLSTLGYGLAVLYYLDHNGKLSKGLRTQFIFVMLAVVVLVIAFSDWGGKVV